VPLRGPDGREIAQAAAELDRDAAGARENPAQHVGIERAPGLRAVEIDDVEPRDREPRKARRDLGRVLGVDRRLLVVPLSEAYAAPPEYVDGRDELKGAPSPPFARLRQVRPAFARLRLAARALRALALLAFV
jgi:hypothetical protein